MKKLLSLIFAGLLISACDVNKPIDNFSIGIEPQLMEYSAMIDIFDVADSTAPANLMISIASNNAEDVYEASGIRDLTTMDGRIEIGLHPRANPLPNDPVNVRLHITADGYIDVFHNIQFNESTPRQVVPIPMVNRQNPPSGVQFKTENATLQGDSLATPYTATVNPGGGSTVGMQIDLPTGLSFIDRSGNPISGGNLEMQIGQFDPSSEAALTAFPGGFGPDSITLEDGSIGSGNFVTAGFTSLDFSVGGTEVKSFNKPITVTMELASGALNPETGAAMAAGDSIPIWSYDENEGIWTYETTGIVSQGSNGLEVQYQTTHLSSWNLDHYEEGCYSANITTNIQGLNAGESEVFDLKMYIAGTKQLISSTYGSKTLTLLSGSNIRMSGGVPSFNVDIKAYKANTTDLVGELTNVSLCSGSHTLNINLIQPVVFTLEVDGYCQDNPNTVIRPSFFIFYKKTGSSGRPQILGFVNKGSFTTTLLELNETYDFTVYYGGDQPLEFPNWNVNLTDYKFNFPFPTSLCDKLGW